MSLGCFPVPLLRRQGEKRKPDVRRWDVLVERKEGRSSWFTGLGTNLKTTAAGDMETPTLGGWLRGCCLCGKAEKSEAGAG
jgi:hypothetical protein